jgi:hypothetical protein
MALKIWFVKFCLVSLIANSKLICFSSDCNKVFDNHDSNISHWKTDHPGKEVVYRCMEEDSSIEEQCPFESRAVSEVYKHQARHKTRENSSKEKLFE